MIKKTKEEILVTYKRANKEYRAKMMAREGYKDEVSFLKYLQGTKKVTTKKISKVKPLIHNVYILDASGSMMGEKFDNALKGINSEIKELSKDIKTDYLQTIVDFAESYDIQTPFFKFPLNGIKNYTSETRGSTALNQAIGQTLDKILKDQESNEKVLVKIFTDGGENASQGEYKNNSILSQKIKQCEAVGFTITFVGTEYDVNKVISNLHIYASNTLVHDNTVLGVATAFKTSTRSTINYASKVSAGEDVLTGFYKEQGTI